MVKSDPEIIMEATSTAHFSGLHFDDEYPVPKYKGANKVPFVIGEWRRTTFFFIPLPCVQLLKA
jgi:hypothetical protein